jgi:hypothetical protein
VGRGRLSRDALYVRLDTQIEELWLRLGGLPSPVEARDIWQGIWFEEAHHSTALEGATHWCSRRSSNCSPRAEQSARNS